MLEVEAIPGQPRLVISKMLKRDNQALQAGKGSNRHFDSTKCNHWGERSGRTTNGCSMSLTALCPSRITVAQSVQ